jgi:hypothetical protein
MSQDWFYQKGRNVYGPVSFPTLRSFARHLVISPDDWVQLGKKGAWLPAQSLAGLFADAAVPQLDEEWYFFLHGKEEGPRPFEQLQTMVANGQLPADAHIRLGKHGKWMSAGLLSAPDETDSSDGSDDKRAAGATQTLESKKEWFCRIEGDEFGPVNLEFLRKLFVTERLSSEDEIRSGHGKEWLRFGYIQDHFARSESKPCMEIEWESFPKLFEECLDNLGSSMSTVTHASSPREPARRKMTKRRAPLPIKRSIREMVSSLTDWFSDLWTNFRDHVASMLSWPATYDQSATAAEAKPTRPKFPTSSSKAIPWPVRLPSWSTTPIGVPLFEKLRDNWAVVAALAVWILINAVVVSLQTGNADGRRNVREILREFPPDSIDQEFFDIYETYHGIWSGYLDLRGRDADETEWSDFIEQTQQTLDLTFKDLETSSEPAKVFLMRTGKLYLLPVLQKQNSQTRPSHLEPRFLKSMQDAMRGLDKAGYDASPI